MSKNMNSAPREEVYCYNSTAPATTPEGQVTLDVTYLAEQKYPGDRLGHMVAVVEAL